jgi:PAS domain-containing protein
MNYWEYLISNYSFFKWVSENVGWLKALGAFLGINALFRSKFSKWMKDWFTKGRTIVNTHVEVREIKKDFEDFRKDQHAVNNSVNDKLDYIIKELKATDALGWALKGYDADSYFAADSNGGIRIVSRSILHTIGCSIEDFIGFRWMSFIKNTVERQRIKSLWDEAFANLTYFEENVTFLNNNNAHVHIRVKCSPVFSEPDGMLQAWAGTFERI